MTVDIHLSPIQELKSQDRQLQYLEILLQFLHKTFEANETSSLEFHH